MTCNLTYEQIQGIRSAFAVLDQNKDGFIDVCEIKKLMAAAKTPVSDDQAQVMIAAFDKNGDGRVSQGEFQSTLARSLPCKEDLMQAFQHADKDGDGWLSAHELRQVLGTHGQWLAMDEVEMVIVQLDKDGDGRLDYNEFIAILSR